MPQALSLDETKFYQQQLVNKQYSEIPYLTKVKLKDMENKIVRLDQLANFQHELSFIPKELKSMIKQSSLKQAYFLLQHAL